MNEIVHKVLLAVDKFMPQIHLKQPGITYSTCGPFIKKQREEFKNLKKQEMQALFTKMNLACFQHDIAYGDFKDLTRTTASDNVLRNKAFNIVKNPKYDGYQRGLASMVYKCFDKKSEGVVLIYH